MEALEFDIEPISRAEWDGTPSAEALRFRKHYRSGNYVRPASSRSGKSGVKATLLELPICAIDGEGTTHKDGSHHYTDLRAVWGAGPDERMHVESASLSTEQCFEFLLALPEHHVYVGYGLSYDTNMWLRMLPYRVIDLLLDKGKALFKHYKLQWIERKFFRISRAGRSFTVYDVLANWQTTFVKALEAWRVGTPEQRAFVALMKEQRGELDKLPRAEVARYCDLECELLRDLCRSCRTP